MKMRRVISFVTALIMMLSLMMPLLTAVAAEEEPLKKRATYYTEEKIKSARENIEKYDWAKAIANPIIEKADKFVSQGYAFIWDNLASQGLPRSYAVNQPDGCLNCGKAIDAHGNYPYIYDPIGNPWTITCPSCQMVFPTNDFKSFYFSALDENGNFDASRGDKEYLKNIRYPEKGENWGVDDGWGYTHTDGKRYTFVAYYNHEANYRYTLNEAISAAYQAYLFTGEQKYADWVIVALDRIAQIYPEMTISNLRWNDGFLHSDAGRETGKIMGCIWETTTVRPYLFAYDAVYGAYDSMSDEAKEFLKTVSHGERDTYKKLMCHVEEGLFMEIFPAVRDGVIYGNQGMHQYTLAAAAMILDDDTLSKEWLDFVFATSSGDSGNLSGVFTNEVDRNGFGREAAPGYNALWIDEFIGIAELLSGYKIGGDGASYDLFQNVKFKKMLYAFIDLIVSDRYIPSIGDTGYTGLGIIDTQTSSFLTAYSVYDDPRLAQLIYLKNNNSTDGLPLNLFDSGAGELTTKIENIIKEEGPLEVDSVNLTGYGYACVKGFDEEEGTEAKNSETTVYHYYGKTGEHGHLDALNLGLFAYDIDLMPDLGYPEFADGSDYHETYLVNNTTSHNTVLVNDYPQAVQTVGTPCLFDDSDFVKVISTKADVYRSVMAEEYKRTTATVKYGDGQYYLVDFFAVKGGNKHTYILHGAESSLVTPDGIDLIPQEGGTLFSPTGTYGVLSDYAGYFMFKDVKKTDSVTGDFTVDWSIVDTWNHSEAEDVHLKVHMFGEHDRVALADCVPPTNKPGNPDKLTYLFADRVSKDDSPLVSMFNSVIEPYSETPIIVSAQQVPVYEKGSDKAIESEDVKAVKVVLANGRTDIIAFSNEKDGKTYNVDGIFDFTGSLVVYSVLGDEKVVYTNDAYVSEGKEEDRRITGTVEDFTKELTDENYITVTLDSDYPAEELAGEYIYIDKNMFSEYNACFKIESAEKLSDGKYSIFIGDVTPIDRLTTEKEAKLGEYIYSIAKNKNFYIPLSKIEGDAKKVYFGAEKDPENIEGDESGTGDENIGGDVTEPKDSSVVIWIAVILAVVIAAGVVVAVMKAKKRK